MPEPVGCIVGVGVGVGLSGGSGRPQTEEGRFVYRTSAASVEGGKGIEPVSDARRGL